MGFFDDVLGSAVPQGSYAKPLMIALGALLASGALTGRGSGGAATNPSSSAANEPDGGLLGGLGGLLSRFQQSGHGDIISSWIGSGPNQAITPSQLGSALGPGIVKTLSEKTGMSEQDLTAELSKVLPGVIDKLTPGGRLPTEAEIASAR